VTALLGYFNLLYKTLAKSGIGGGDREGNSPLFSHMSKGEQDVFNSIIIAAACRQVWFAFLKVWKNNIHTVQFLKVEK